MAKAKVIVDFSTNRYSDIELNVKLKTISTCLTDNPKFLALAPTVVILKTNIERFSTLVELGSEGNKQSTVEKNSVRGILEPMAASLAVQVQEICEGDELQIISAGFDVKRKATPIGELERPANVVAVAGSSRGSLAVSWSVVPNAYIYEIQYTDAPSTADSVWQRTSNTKRKITLENLVRGKAYAIVVAGAGTDPRRVWSDEIISYVM
ncbi:MAG: fibronectin type III domain-containing protein [Paludibacter sp.]